MPVPRPSYPMISDIQLMAVAKDAGYEAEEARKLATFFRRLMDKQAIDERENYRYIDKFLDNSVGINYQRLMTLNNKRVWADPADTWTGSELPTTGLRPGRMVRATNLDSTKYSFFSGNRIFYYWDGWYMLTPRRLGARLLGNVTVAGDLISTPQMEVDFGFAPCNIGVEVTLQGAAYRSGASDARAKVSLYEGLASDPSPIDVRHIHIVCPALADATGRPTGSCTYFSGRNTGADNQRIAYHARFEAIGTGGVVFAGDSKCYWELVVTVS